MGGRELALEPTGPEGPVAAGLGEGAPTVTVWVGAVGPATTGEAGPVGVGDDGVPGLPPAGEGLAGRETATRSGPAAPL
jgi:hypothetical protein